MVKAKLKRTGHLWQDRYGAAAMDEDHLAAAFRYILRSPVQAGLAQHLERWRRSSAVAYLDGISDGFTDTEPMLVCFPDMAALLKTDNTGAEGVAVAGDETAGRPRGSAAFRARIEGRTNRRLASTKRGPKPRETDKGTSKQVYFHRSS